jgi:hypothetical protein
VVTGGEHVRERQEVRNEAFVRLSGRGDERPVGQGDADHLTLSTVDHVPVAIGVAPAPSMDAGRVDAAAAEGAGVVGEHERGDHEVARLDRLNVGSDLLDDADELVADPPGTVHLGQPAIGPEVGPADTSGHDTDDGITVLDQLGSVDIFDADVSGGVENGGSHGPFLSTTT